MQITHNHRKVVGWMLRIMILSVCIWFIGSQLDEKWTIDTDLFQGKWTVILLVGLLSFVNWGLEVWRWKWSLESIASTSWQEAMKQVFSGLALNWIMPFTSGDLAARLLPQADKKRVGVMVYYNRAIMLVITMLFGAWGVFVYSGEMFNLHRWSFGVVLLVIISIGFLANRFKRSTDKKVQNGFILRLALLSIFRYLIFVWQFYLLIYVFNPELNTILIVGGIGWVFLFRSILPSLFGNLGVREASAFLFFTSHVDNVVLILAPSLLIWIINTVIPSILGLYFLLKFRIKLAS